MEQRDYVTVNKSTVLKTNQGPLLLSYKKVFLTQALNSSQKIIRLLEKRQRCKRLFENWRPIPILSTDVT